MYMKNEDSYSDGTPEFILQFENGHPLFETEVCDIRSGKIINGNLDCLTGPVTTKDIQILPPPPPSEVAILA